MNGFDQSIIATPTPQPRSGQAVGGDRGSSSGRKGGASEFDGVLARTGGNAASGNAPNAEGSIDAKDSAPEQAVPSKPSVDIRFQKLDTKLTSDKQEGTLTGSEAGNSLLQSGVTDTDATADIKAALTLPLGGKSARLDGEDRLPAQGEKAVVSREKADEPGVSTDKTRIRRTDVVAGDGNEAIAQKQDGAGIDEKAEKAIARLVSGAAQKTASADGPDDAAAPTTAAATDTAETPLVQLFDLLGMPGGQPAALAANLAPAASDQMGNAAEASAALALGGLGKSDATNQSAERDAPTTDGEQDAARETEGKDRLFRFARADGTGDALTMRVGGDGSQDAATSAENAKADQVTVLDSRRYLGVALPANAQSVTNAIAASIDGQTSLMSSTVHSDPEAWSSAGKVLHTLKIQLNPIELGSVTATLRLKDNELQVELKVASNDALRQLSGDQEMIARSLRDQGFAIDQITVVLSPAADSGSSGQSAAQNSGAGQQATDPQTRQQASEGRAQDERRQGGHEQAAGGDWRMDNASEDLAAAGDRYRTDDVYI